MPEPKKPKPGDERKPDRSDSVIEWLENATERLESVVDRPQIDSTDGTVSQDIFDQSER